MTVAGIIGAFANGEDLTEDQYNYFVDHGVTDHTVFEQSPNLLMIAQKIVVSCSTPDNEVWFTDEYDYSYRAPNCTKLILEAMGYLGHWESEWALQLAGVMPWHTAVAEKFVQDLTYGQLPYTAWDLEEFAYLAVTDEPMYVGETGYTVGM